MTLEIRKTNGEFSADSRAAWQAFTRSLPNGCYLLACFECGSAAGQIEALAAWYNAATETEKDDPAFLHVLSAKSDSLAFYIYRLADETGDLLKEKEVAELRRKDTFHNVIYRQKKEAKEQGVKFVHAVAVTAAEIEVAELYDAETRAAAIYQKSKLLLEAAYNIQQRMSQRISSLRAFRDAGERSNNQNFP